jgi:hypothetical protein
MSSFTCPSQGLSNHATPVHSDLVGWFTKTNIFLNNVFQLPTQYPPHPCWSSTELGLETIFVLNICTDIQ